MKTLKKTKRNKNTGTNQFADETKQKYGDKPFSCGYSDEGSWNVGSVNKRRPNVKLCDPGTTELWRFCK